MVEELQSSNHNLLLQICHDANWKVLEQISKRLPGDPEIAFRVSYVLNQRERFSGSAEARAAAVLAWMLSHRMGLVTGLLPYDVYSELEHALYEFELKRKEGGEFWERHCDDYEEAIRDLQSVRSELYELAVVGLRKRTGPQLADDAYEEAMSRHRGCSTIPLILAELQRRRVPCDSGPMGDMMSRYGELRHAVFTWLPSSVLAGVQAYGLREAAEQYLHNRLDSYSELSQKFLDWMSHAGPEPKPLEIIKFAGAVEAMLIKKPDTFDLAEASFMENLLRKVIQWADGAMNTPHLSHSLASQRLSDAIYRMSTSARELQARRLADEDFGPDWPQEPDKPYPEGNPVEWVKTKLEIIKREKVLAIHARFEEAMAMRAVPLESARLLQECVDMIDLLDSSVNYHGTPARKIFEAILSSSCQIYEQLCKAHPRDQWLELKSKELQVRLQLYQARASTIRQADGQPEFPFRDRLRADQLAQIETGALDTELARIESALGETTPAFRLRVWAASRES
jgi:hypothetical protein